MKEDDKVITSMTKTKMGIIVALLIGGAAIFGWIQRQGQLAAREENRALQAEVNQLAAENEQLSNQVAQASARPATGSEQERELLKLRGEVGSLKRQLAEAARARTQAEAQAQAQAQALSIQRATEQDAAEQQKQAKEMAIAKLGYAKGWMMAFWQYAQQHGGQFPSDFESAAAFAPDSIKGQSKLTPEQFEIVYKGLANEMTNPQSVIVIREKQAWQTAEGGWAKGYSFADGHSEIHMAADGNFQPWEAEHVAVPRAAGGAQPGQ
jgi:hypothetical protein